MTDCPNGDIRDLLPDLLHGRLGAVERVEVEAHLRDCADCRDELELLRGVRVALRRTRAVDVGEIVAGIQPYRGPVTRTASRSWGGWRIAAAVTLLAAGGTSVVVARNGPFVRTDSTPVTATAGFDSVSGRAPIEIVTASSNASGATSASQRELALAGGTIGELDDSELSSLIADLGSIEAVTPADVDNAAPVGPIAPTPPSGMNN